MKQDLRSKAGRRILISLSGILALAGLSLQVEAAEPVALNALTRFALENPAYATHHDSTRLLPYWDAWLMGPVSAGAPGQARLDGNDGEAPPTAPAPQAAKSDAQAEATEADMSAIDKGRIEAMQPDSQAPGAQSPASHQPAAQVPAVIPRPSAKAWLYISKKSQRIYLKDVAAGTSDPDAKPDTTLASWPVSTARYSLSTPVGRFRIISQVPDPPYSGRHGYYKPKDPRNPLGSRWMGLNVGHFRTGVPIGIHGTNEPDKIGQAVSDGCVRLRNADVETLFKLARLSMPVVISNQ